MRDGDRIEERDPKMDAEWLRVIANQADEIDTDADNQTLWPETADNLRDIADYIDRERVATREDVERVAEALKKGEITGPIPETAIKLSASAIEAGRKAFASDLIARPACDGFRGERMSGVERIAAERKRQIESEGWTPTHDAQHELYELARAAACYAERAFLGPDVTVPRAWPWAEEWWKPGDPIRMLEKAGALIAAEIDRRLAMMEGE